MKKVMMIILAGLLALPLLSCGKKPEQQPTAAPVSGTPLPDGVTADPNAAPSGKPIFFDPETDYDNRYGSIISCDMVETEDAYYLHNRETNGFLYYYDNASGESGVLCPRPECVHDAKRENRECTGYLGYELPSLQYYQGRLWFFESPYGRKIRLCHMNLDGSEKTLVHEFEPADTPLEYGNRRLYLHRGMIYYTTFNQTISGAAIFHRIYYGCIPMEDTTIGGKKVRAWECYSILERDTIHMPQPSMYFAGDYCYMLYDYDGVTDYDGANTEEDYYAWKRTLPVTDEIDRWDPTMAEPEILYQSVETYSMLGNYHGKYVASDGTPYFTDSQRLDPEQPEGEDNPYITRLYRVEKDGSRTIVLETDPGEGSLFSFALGDGVIVLTGAPFMCMRDILEPVDIRIIRFDGDEPEVIYEGPLPLEYRSELRIGAKDISLEECWVNGDTLMIFSTEYYGRKDYDRSWQFVKYDITPDGLKETVLSEGFQVQFWKSN